MLQQPDPGSMHECFQQHYVFLMLRLFFLSVTPMSAVWSQTTIKLTPRRPTHPSCLAVLHPATVARASFPRRQRHASLCPPHEHHALLVHPVDHLASRVPSSMTTRTFTPRRPRLPLVDHSAPWSRPLSPPFPRPTACMSPSFSPSPS